MSAYRIQQHVDLRRVHIDRDERYLAHVEQSMRRELASKLTEELPLDQPTMVRMRREDFESYETRSQVIRYELEVTACRTMDVTVQRFIEPEPEIRYVEHKVLVPVYITAEKPSFWQRVVSHVQKLAAGPEYDGGYGEPA